MKPFLRFLNRCPRFAGIVFALIGPAASADMVSSLFSVEPDVIANTDMFDASGPTPAPGKPVYYMAVSKGYRQFGYDMGGEKIPESRGVLKMISKILETQGYKLATTEHAPTLVILYSWGNFYVHPDPMVRNNYAAEMIEFLGGNKVGLRTHSRHEAVPELDRDLASLNPDSSTIEGFLAHGMYVITFWGFDFVQAQKGVAKLFWKTNISSSTRGFYLPEILPTMLTIAAPLIGRQTNRPVRIDVGKHYTPRVDLGTLRIIEEDVKLKEPK